MVSRGQKRSLGFDRGSVRAWQRRHNRRALLSGIGLLLLSALLWLMTYWAVKIFFFLLTVRLVRHIGEEGHARMASVAGVALLVVLVLECALYGKRRYDRHSYANSVVLKEIVDGEQEFVARRLIAGWFTGDDLLRDLLFVAPRCTARAVESLTSYVTLPPALLHRAQAILAELAGKVTWTPVGPFLKDGLALVRLRKMGLVQVRVKKGVGEIRLTPRVLRPTRAMSGL